MTINVEQKELPGVGMKYVYETEECEVIVIVRNDGRRELFRRDNPNEDAEELLNVSDQEARIIGTLLEGAYFQPVADEPIREDEG
jgi:TrkA domain protein